MKKLLHIILGLTIWSLVLAWVYDQANLWLMLRSPSNNAGKIHRLLVESPAGNIPLFGSSRACGNFAPSLIDDRVYNYGVNGMSIAESLFLINRYLERHNEGIILINLDPWGFVNENHVKFIGDYRLAGIRSEVREALPNGKLKWQDWMPLVRFQGSLRSSLTAYINSLHPTTKRIDKGSELLLNSRTKEEWEVINKGVRAQPFAKADNCSELLKEMYSKRGNVTIVWIVSPISPYWYSLYTGNDDLQMFLKEESAKENVYTFNYVGRTEDFPTELFVDPTHMNVHGAEKFSRMLRDDLIKIGIFK